MISQRPYRSDTRKGGSEANTSFAHVRTQKVHLEHDGDNPSTRYPTKRRRNKQTMENGQKHHMIYLALTRAGEGRKDAGQDVCTPEGPREGEKSKSRRRCTRRKYTPWGTIESHEKRHHDHETPREVSPISRPEPTAPFLQPQLFPLTRLSEALPGFRTAAASVRHELL